MSLLLAVDTATPAVVAGVVRGDDAAVLGRRVTVDPRAHAELLTPHIVAALTEAQVAGTALDAVVVGCGPGPFTGLRVGIATAAAWGHALGVGVYGVCSLDGIGVGTGSVTAGEVLVVTDARRREVYWARYRDGERIAGPGVAAPADVPVGGALAVAGSPQHAAMFGLPVLDAPHPTPDGLVRAARPLGEPALLTPLYLRRPDAVPPPRGCPAPTDIGPNR